MKASIAIVAAFAGVCQGAPLRSARSATMPLLGYLNKEAIWQKAPYHYGARDAAPIIGAIDAIVYKSLTIEDSTFTISNENQEAADEYLTLSNYKLTHPDLQTLFSVGGPMLPSSTWSEMVASEAYRASFIASAVVPPPSIEPVELMPAMPDGAINGWNGAVTFVPPVAGSPEMEYP
eukprot:gene25651-5671_t